MPHTSRSASATSPTVARARSEDQSALQGGLVGFFSEAQLQQTFPPDVAARLFAMQPGQIMDPIAGQGGRLHIFKLNGKREQQQEMTYEQVKPQIAQTITDQRKQVNDAFKQCKQTIDQAAEQATTAANQMKTSAVAQVQSTASSTSSQLSAHGASQVAAIRSAAAGARAGIQKAGAAAIASVTQGVNQAAKGLEQGAQARSAVIGSDDDADLRRDRCHPRVP